MVQEDYQVRQDQLEDAEEQDLEAQLGHLDHQVNLEYPE